MTVHKRFTKRLALLTASAVMCMNVSAIEAVDYKGHWAQDALTEWVSLGIIKGYEDGTVRPSQPITRAELAALVGRVFNLNYENASVSYDDVTEGVWYEKAVEIAMSAELMNDFGNEFRPNQLATREEAAYAIARAYHISGGEAKEFSDSSEISDWAKDEIEALVANGYLHGRPDGTLAPQDSLTRADFVMMLDKITAKLYNNAGAYTEDVKGNVVINTSDVTLKDMTISGNLYIAEGVGEGDVTLDNVEVEGRVIIEGGGENSIEVKGSQIKDIYVDKATGGVRVALDKKSTVENIKVASKAQLEGNIKSLEINTNKEIKLVGAEVENMKISVAGSQIELDAKSIIKELIANAKAEIKGQGKVEKASVNADDVVFDGLEIDEDAITVGDEVSVPPTIENPQGGSNSSSGSSESNRPEKPAVTGIGIYGDYQVTTGASIQLIADVTTNIDDEELKEVEWSIKEGSLQDVSVDQNGLFRAGSTTGSAIVVATSKYNPAMRAEHIIEVINQDQYVPVESIIISHQSAALKPGQHLQLEVDIQPANATNKTLIWQSSNPDVVEVSNNGLIRAIRGGDAVITATTSDGKHTVECVVTVDKNAPVISNVRIEGPTTVEAGSSTQFKAYVTVTPDAEQYKDVIWGIKLGGDVPEDIPEGIKITNDGVLEVGNEAGQVTIVASSRHDVNKYDEHTVTITKKVPVEHIQLSEYEKHMLLGDTAQFTATVFPDNATNKEVIWESDRPDLVTVDKAGNIVAKGVGTANIKVTAVNNRHATTSAAITVEGYTLKGKVTLEGEGTKEGIDVRLYSEDNKHVETVKTNSLGEYIFDELPKGNYRIRVNYAGETVDYAAPEKEVSLTEATQEVNTIELKKQTTLEVTVVDRATDKPINYIWVTGKAQDKELFSTGTNGAGKVNVTLPQSTSGEITYIVANKGGGGYAQLELIGSIKEKQRNEVTIKLTKEKTPQYTVTTSAALGVEDSTIGDWVYETLKEAGWTQGYDAPIPVEDQDKAEPSKTKLSLYNRALQFEYFKDSKDDIDAVLTCDLNKVGNLEDFEKVLQYMLPTGTNLTFDELKLQAYNGTNTLEDKVGDKTREIKIENSGGGNPIITITFGEYK